jgi:hypothetical protein
MNLTRIERFQNCRKGLITLITFCCMFFLQKVELNIKLIENVSPPLGREFNLDSNAKIKLIVVDKTLKQSMTFN